MCDVNLHCIVIVAHTEIWTHPQARAETSLLYNTATNRCRYTVFLWTHLLAPVTMTTLCMSGVGRGSGWKRGRNQKPQTRSKVSLWPWTYRDSLPIARFRCTHSSSLCAPACAWCDWMSANSWPIRFHYRKPRRPKLGKSTTIESTVQLGSMYVGRRSNRLTEENIHVFFIYKTLWFDSYWKKNLCSSLCFNNIQLFAFLVKGYKHVYKE